MNSLQCLAMFSSLQKRVFLLTTYYLLLTTFMGCATIIEGAKGVAGISTKALEDGRKDAIKKTFNCDYNTCYNKTEEILAHINAYIYAKDTKKQMIAVYVSEEDTTPVGIFFKVIDQTFTQLEVSSPSIYAKEFISTKLFLALEKALNPEKEEGPSDEEKEMGDK